MAAAAIAAMPMNGMESGLTFSNRAHIFARPAVKDELIRCFSTVLGCGEPKVLKVPGLAEPMVAFRFPRGGSLSVEFTVDALSEAQARRGAWLEIWSDEPEELKKKVLGAGYSQVDYGPTNTFYFAAPGGQVLGIVSGKNPGAGELKK